MKSSDIILLAGVGIVGFMVLRGMRALDETQKGIAGGVKTWTEAGEAVLGATKLPGKVLEDGLKFFRNPLEGATKLPGNVLEGGLKFFRNPQDIFKKPYVSGTMPFIPVDSWIRQYAK